MDKITAIKPDIGDKKYGYEIGYSYKTENRNKWIWAACIDCGKERWVHLLHQKPESLRCRICAAKLRGEHKRDYNYKGQTHFGYILIRLHPNNPFFEMSNGRGYLLEHRYIMAQKLGRLLQRFEKVHHKNGIKTDNRIENLELISQSSHQLKEMFCRNCSLREDIKLLQWHIKELKEQLQVRLI